MNDLRTLPIRLQPLSGEALDSWLEALAFRMRMPAGALLRSVGLRRRARLTSPGGLASDWMIHLQPEEASTLALLTGTTANQLMSMTLAAYDGRALLIDQETGQVNRYRLWGRNAGSRYCPDCLAETGGRWSLSWRLGWSFACVHHQCLLADACPGCSRMQRIRRYRGERPLHPAHCSYPAQDSTARFRCGTDLRDTVPVRLDAGHPALSAQQLILETIETGQASFGVYAGRPAASVHALADVKAVAGRALAPASADSLGRHLTPDLLEMYQEARSSGRPADHSPYTPTPHAVSASPGLMAPSHAAVTAAGILAAVDVLGRPCIQEAGEALRWLTVEARSRGQVINPTTAADWGRGVSPVLDGVTLASMQPALRPSHQLRYRVMDALPGPPDPADGRVAALARSTPTLLWPYWALRLAPARISARFLRAALPVLVLLPGTKVSTAEAAAMLGNAIDKADTSRILQVLEHMPQWRQILTALTRLSDYLADRPAPIDYQRRRALSYKSLLPDTEWKQICRGTGAPPGTGYKGHIARAYLFQRLSTLPCDSPPAGIAATASEFRTTLARFPAKLFPELSAQLDNAAQRFLTAKGITGEPVTWQPRLDLIHDLDLPGPDPASVTIAELHRMLYEGNSLTAAAWELGTTLDAVRAVLAENPAPARRVSHGQGRLPGPIVRAAEIPKAELEQLYLRERLSTRQIAARYRVNKETVANLLRSHGIPLGWHPPVGVTPEWLGREYAEKGRTLKDLAAEVGSSPVALSRWAKKWGIVVRPRGRSGRSATVPLPELRRHRPAASSADTRRARTGVTEPPACPADVRPGELSSSAALECPCVRHPADGRHARGSAP